MLYARSLKEAGETGLAVSELLFNFHGHLSSVQLYFFMHYVKLKKAFLPFVIPFVLP